MSKQTAIAQLGHVNYGRRNLYINGKASVWQRGTSFSSFTSANIFTADHWFMGSSYSNLTVAKNSNQTVNNTIVNTIKISATGSSGFDFYQPVEDYWLLSGQTCTISFWYKTNLDGISLRHYATETLDTLDTTNGSWEYYSHTFTFGTTQSNPRAANGGTIGFWNNSVSVGNGDYFEFTMIQLELGNVATPFEHRTYAEEYDACLRYYQRIPSKGGNRDFAAYPMWNYSSGGSSTRIRFQKEMRAKPTITKVGAQGSPDPSSDGWGYYHAGSWRSVSFSFGEITEESTRADATGASPAVSSGGASGLYIYNDTDGSDNYLQFEAEL